MASVLSRCAHSALALLYPFTWQHTFVPVLPASMLDICCSPTPFVMGALSPSLPEVQDMPIEEVSHFEGAYLSPLRIFSTEIGSNYVFSYNFNHLSEL